MHTSSDLIKIIGAAELLSNDIRNSDVAKEYYVKKKELAANVEAQELIYTFNQNKIQFDEAERFGKYYPNYDEVVKKTLASKKEMDMHEIVMDFKKSETRFLEMLEEVSQIISMAVSKSIEVPSDVPLSGGKKCSCGGSCSCS